MLEEWSPRGIAGPSAVRIHPIVHPRAAAVQCCELSHEVLFYVCQMAQENLWVVHSRSS